MNQVLTTVPAHFDGNQIRLDVKVKLKPDTRLLVTILSEDIIDEDILAEKAPNEALVLSAMKASEAAFDRVWDNDEDAVYDLL